VPLVLSTLERNGSAGLRHGDYGSPPLCSPHSAYFSVVGLSQSSGHHHHHHHVGSRSTGQADGHGHVLSASAASAPAAGRRLSDAVRAATDPLPPRSAGENSLPAVAAPSGASPYGLSPTTSLTNLERQRSVNGNSAHGDTIYDDEAHFSRVSFYSCVSLAEASHLSTYLAAPAHPMHRLPPETVPEDSGGGGGEVRGSPQPDDGEKTASQKQGWQLCGCFGAPDL